MKSVPSQKTLTVILEGRVNKKSNQETVIGYHTVEKEFRDPKTGIFGKHSLVQKNKPIMYKEAKYEPAKQVRVISEDCLDHWGGNINALCKSIYEATPGAIGYYIN